MPLWLRRFIDTLLISSCLRAFVATVIPDIMDCPISSPKTRSKPALFDVFRVISPHFSSFFVDFSHFSVKSVANFCAKQLKHTRLLKELALFLKKNSVTPLFIFQNKDL